MCPSAVARNVLPTPTGPRINALWFSSTKRIEVGCLGPHPGRPPVTAGHLVGEHHLQEVDVRHRALPCRRQSLGQGVGHLAEPQRREDGPELGRDRQGRRAHLDTSTVAMNSDLSRANRPWIGMGSGGFSLCSASVARSIIRAISFTLIASASRARSHAISTRCDPHFFTRLSSRYAWRILVQGSGLSSTFST